MAQTPTTALVGGSVFHNGTFADETVLVRDGQIAGFCDAEAPVPSSVGETIDASGCRVVPGFVDIHFHGCRGVDFCDGSAEAISTIARFEASRGVTSICPATMTYPEETLARIMDAARAWHGDKTCAHLVGINMEGPFISPEKVGAQNPLYVQVPDAAMLERLQSRSGGLVKLVDVAPEVEGAIGFIEAVIPHIRVSIAHTCANYDQAKDAFAAGARQMTHLYNAMPGMHHRHPGPIPAAVECPDAMAEIIADGVHIEPAMVRLAFSLFGDERIILISDSMMATGMDDGEYSLGGQAVTVRGNVATLHDGTIAGSATDLASCLRIAVRGMGIPLASAVRASTENPARAIGIFDECGSIDAGKRADIVLLDEDLLVKQVILRGETL